MLQKRFEMERNINRLREYSLDSKLNITSDSRRTINDIRKARYLPNGRVNLQTIGVGIRSVSNTVAHLTEGEN